MTETSFKIDPILIDNRDAIFARIESMEESDRAAVRTVLEYLFLTDGPVSIARDTKSRAEKYLSPVELFVFQWLFKRTDGKLRRHAGPAALAAVKRSRYQCETCAFDDVRALILDKIESRIKDAKPQFSCQCANCNTIAARTKEMAEVASNKERVEALKSEENANQDLAEVVDLPEIGPGG